MNHEHEQDHIILQTGLVAHDDVADPGQSSRNDLLRKPNHAVASGLILRKASDLSSAGAPSSDEVLSRLGGGSSLSPSTQVAMSDSLGGDFSDVKIHTGISAAVLCKEMNAKAFTIGNDVAFGEGQYQPGTSEGDGLIAHELTHTIQQNQGRTTQLSGLGGDSDSRNALEQEADRNAAKVQRKAESGGDAGDLLPALTVAQPSVVAAQRNIQFQLNPQNRPAEMAEVQNWINASRIGVETIMEVQRVCGIAQTGIYNEATVRAVYAKQQQLGIDADGMADVEFCRRTGVIFTQTITAGAVEDAVLQQVEEMFSNGVTIAICVNYNASIRGHAEFRRRANQFAQNQHAVGLSGGAVAFEQVCMIEDVGDVIEVVQSIHRGLLQKWNASHGVCVAPPACTKVRNLALFAHGESYGMGLTPANHFQEGGLINTTCGSNPSNVESFVRGLSEAVVPDVRVELFACSTGSDTTRTDEWTNHAQGDRAGGDSVASSIAQALGPDATVSAHTTGGHTTENFAARVFGAEAGGGAQGISLFDVMYPETFVQSELVRLFPDLDDEARTARHDSLRDQMWEHFKDSISGEHNRTQKRYPVPLGQETFVNPDNARALLYADWTAHWIPTHLAQVRATRRRR